MKEYRDEIIKRATLVLLILASLLFFVQKTQAQTHTKKMRGNYEITNNLIVDSTTTSAIVSVGDSLQINGSAYVDSIVDFGDFTYEKHIGGITTVGTSTYSLVATDYFLEVTYSVTGSCTITLPTAQIVRGRTIIIKDGGFNATTNNITITCEGASETIDGSTSDYIITSDSDAINLTSNGTGWLVH